MLYLVMTPPQWCQLPSDTTSVGVSLRYDCTKVEVETRTQPSSYHLHKHPEGGCSRHKLGSMSACCQREPGTRVEGRRLMTSEMAGFRHQISGYISAACTVRIMQAGEPLAPICPTTMCLQHIIIMFIRRRNFVYRAVLTQGMYLNIE